MKQIELKELVLLWHKTQIGNAQVCQEKTTEFCDIMWKLYEEFKNDVVNKTK